MQTETTATTASVIAFIFNNISNHELLVAAFRDDVEVHVLDARADGLAQIAAVLAGRQGVDEIHIVGHGAPGTLHLGTQALDSANVNAHAAVLGRIGAALAPDGDILLYGCDIAADAMGAQFVGQLARATGADVAASDDATGGQARGGDWTLEYRHGQVGGGGSFDGAAARSLDVLLALPTPGLQDVTTSMDVGSFVPGFDLSVLPGLSFVKNDDPAGIYFYSTASTSTETKDATFTVSADTYNLGRFDLTNIAFLKYTGDPAGSYLFTVTGTKLDGTTVTTTFHNSSNQLGFDSAPDYSAMTGLKSFSVRIQAERAAYPVSNYTFDGFSIANPMPNTHPAFVGTDTLTAAQGSATDVAAALHVNDPDSYQTLTWSQDTAPAHGTLSFSGATASGGSADVTPGGTITYTPAAGYVGADSFKIKVTDGLTTIVRTVNVTVNPAAPSAPDLQGASDTGLSPTDNITNAATLNFAGTGAAGDSTSTVRVFVDRNGNGVYDAGDLSTTTTMSAGAWSLGLAAGALTDGTYNVYAQSTNGAATSAVSTPLSLNVDRTAPTLSITSNKAALKAGETATITFTFSEDPGASFTLADVAVAGGALGALSGSGTTRTATFTPTANTNESTATISVAANSYTDAAGNNGGAGTTPSLSFDTKAPAAPVLSGLAAGSDSGTLADGRTNAASPVLSGSAEAGSTVTLYGSDGTTVLGTATAAGDGSFSVTASGLAEGAHTLTAKAADAKGNVSPASGSFTLAIDRTAPTLSITSSVATLKATETATITFTFSEDPGSSFVHTDIAVTGGTLGALSGSGTTRTAVFTPTANSSGTASITVASGAYTDAAGNNGGAGTTPALTYDTYEQSVTITSDVSTLKVGQTATITFTFAKDPGTSFVHGDISVTGGTLGPLSGTGLTRTATFTPTAGVNGGTAVIEVPAGSYTDLGGNPGTAGAPRNLSYDTLAPGAPAGLSLASASDTGVSNSDRVTQDTTPTVTGTADAGTTVTLYDGASPVGSATAAGDGSWSITTSALSNGMHGLSAKAADAAGNASTASGVLAVTVDTTGPTLAITSDRATLKASETATITFTFSEDPGASFSWDGSTGDVLVSGGTLGALSGTGTVRTAVFTPNANTNTTSASITVATGTYTDAAGNNGGAGVTPSLSFDTKAPTVAITSNKSSLKAGDTAAITFTFSEDPGASFTVDDVAVTGGTLTLDAGSGATRTATFTPTAATNGGTASITIASGLYTDAAGNAGAAGTTPSLVFDTLAPAVPTLALAAGMDTGASSSDHLTNIARPSFTGTAEVGATVRLYRNGVEIGSGTANGAGNWTITPSSDLSAGSHFMSVDATDAAGNTGAATNPLDFSVIIDTTPPTLAISSSKAALKAGETATITFTFSEDPGSTFTLDDVAVSGGTLGPLAGSGNTRTALFTPAAGSNGPSASIAVGTAKFADAAGNDNSVVSNLNLSIDTRAPAVAVTSSAPTLKAGETATITFTFDEEPVGLTIGDVVATGGTVSGLAGTGTTRTVTFTPADAVNGGTANIKLNAGSYTDAQGNDGAAGEVNLTYDTAVPGAPAALALAAGSDSGSSSIDRLTNVARPTISGTAEAGATVRLYDGATEIGSATVDGAGNWSVSLGADLAGGAHSITAKAFDAAGNASGASATLAVTVDTTAPAAPAALALASGSDSGSSAVDGLTNVVRPEIRGTAETGATVKLYDGAAEIGSATADGAGNWSFTPGADLSVGAHSITAKATDAAGNTGAVSATLGITIDTAAPAAPLGLSLSAATDSGSSSSDGLTNVARPTIRGTAEAGASVKLYDGATEIGSATADGTGNWSLALGADLSPGAHSITAKATDAAGNASGASAAFAVTIDTAAPSAPAALALDAGSDSGSSASDRLTNVARPAMTGSAEANATVRLYDGATEIGSTTADGAGNWSLAPGADLASGLHTLTAKAFDAAGNASAASAALAVTIDTTAPAAPAALALAAGSDSGSSSSDGLTNVVRPGIRGTAEAGATVKLYDGATEIGSATADGVGNWSFTPSADLSVGAHSITAKATDAAGNTSVASAAMAVTVDTGAPAAPATLSLAPGSDSGSSSSDGVTSVVRPTIRGTAEAGASVTLYDGATEIGSATADGTGNWSVALGADLSPGAHSITAKATDAAGNASAASPALGVTIDTSAPGAPAALALAAGSDSGSSASDRLTNIARPTFSGTAEAGATVTLYDGATEIGSATVDGAGNWSVTAGADLAGGAHSITAKTFDPAGNASGASATLAVTIDTSAPAAPAALALATGSDSGSSSSDGVTNVVRPTIRGTAEAGATVKLYDGATEIGSATADGAGNWSFTPSADLSVGAHSLAAKATDAAGNTGAASAAFSVTIDTAAPAAPSELALAAGSDSGRSAGDGLTNVSRPTISGKAEAGAAVKLYDGATEIGSTTADGAGNWSIALGADLSTGAHSITARATDGAGNASAASATLGVTIDTAAPTLTIESDKASVKAGETAVVTFRFSEDPGPGFTAGSISVSGGTLEDLSTSGAVRTATFRPAAAANGTAAIAVAAGTYSDAAGNAGGTAASLDIAFHTVIPTVTVSSSMAALAVGETATITFAFSEDPGASFTWDGSAGDLTVTGGTLSAISGSGLTRTAIFTPAPGTDGGTAVIAVSGSYTSPWGNEGLKQQTSLTFDTRAPGAPSAPVLAAGSDSGASAGDNVTRVAAPTVAGTAEAGATVRLYDGATLVGSGTADAGGNWSITTTTLAEGAHAITATATDAAGNVGSTSAALALTVDTTAPTLSIGASKAALAYGETATITFTFSEDPGSSFAWDGTGGDIVVTGGTLSAISGTGTTRTATFTPHHDTNAGTASITVAAGSWADAAGNGGGNGAGPAIHFDTLRPTVAITSDKAALKAGETAVVTFTFSEDPGASFDAADITVSGGTLGTLSGSGTTRSAVFTPAADTNGGSAGITVAALSYADAAGNGGAGGAAAAIAFDTKAPAAPSAPALAASSDTGASASDGITRASELVFQGSAEDGTVVTLVDAATSAVLGTATAAGGTWSVNVAGVAEGAITVAAFAQDAAGNKGPLSAPATVTVDRTALPAPSVAAGEGARLPVTGLADGASWEYSTDNGGHWQKGSGSTIVLPADGGYTVLARQYDVAGNASPASAPLLVSLDTTAPTVQVGLSDRELTKGETATVTFTFSEAVTGFDLGDISAGNASVSQLATSDGGRTWSAQLTPAAGVVSNSNVVRVNNAGVRDLAGNAGVGSSSSPNYTVNSAGLGATIELSDHDLAAGETALVIIRFSEPVKGFSLSDLSVENGKLSQLASGDGGRTWVAVLTPSANVADATNQLVIDNSGVSTANGTRGEGSTVSANYAVSTVRPTAAVSLADRLLAPGASTTVTIRFSEAVTGLDMSDLSTTSGTLANLASTDGGLTWTVQLTAGSGGRAAQPGFVALDMGGLRNGAGNTGQGKVAVQFVQVAGVAQVGNVDGVSVISQSLADPVTGRVEQVMTVTEVTAGRQDDPNTPNAGLADIPIGTPNGASLTASLPDGSGLQVSGPSAPLNGADGLLDLIRRIEGATASGSPAQSEMSGHGQNFLAGLGGETTIETKTLVPTAAPGTTLGQPIVIGGTPPKPGGPAAPAVGLVIDGRALPSGSAVQLENVDFAAVAGDLRVFGGSGRNYVVGDGGAQVIYLGAEDDVLSGGGGNDFIGSAGGDDRLDGGDGNDLVAGGIGNDLAAGGTGDDVVLGGRSVAGDWQFYVSGAALSARHSGAVFSATGSEIVQAGELDAALPELRFLQAGAQKVLDVALLYAALGRTPDLAGLSFWTQSGVSLKQVAAGMLASAEFDGGALGQTSDTVFVRGMYEHVLGRAASDADLQFWTAQLAGGGAAAATRADVLMAVALSDEHRKQVLGADGYLVGQASVAREAAWFGGSGDDRLDGGAGNDFLVGGDGVDTALYQGSRAQYRVLLGPDNSARVLDTASGDIDTLSGVEAAQFRDGTLGLGFLGADTAQLARVGMLYQAVLDRTPDAAGLTWWLSLGMGAAQLAQAFAASPEFLARFGGVSDAAFVQALYANSGLDANAAGGMQSWQAYLGQHTRAELVAAWIAHDDVIHAQYGTSGLWLV